MAIAKRHRAWLLPLVFLAGYLLAWTTVLVDRQMLIEEQRQLQEEVERTRIELRITSMVDEYNEDYVGQVDWNRKALKEVAMICPVCGKVGQRSGGFSETVSTPIGDIETDGWECSSGHKWRAERKNGQVDK